MLVCQGPPRVYPLARLANLVCDTFSQLYGHAELIYVQAEPYRGNVGRLAASYGQAQAICGTHFARIYSGPGHVVTGEFAY